MDDKELFEQLARGPLTRNGFDESLRRKINERLDNPKQRTNRAWFLRWNRVSAAFLLVIVLLVGVWSWREYPFDGDGNKGLNPEQSSALHETVTGDIKDVMPHSAVVIGLRDDGDQGASGSTYRTVLVAPQDNELALIGSGPGIWMPYKTKFWKIDAVPDSLGKGTQTLEASPAARLMKAAVSEEKLPSLRRTEKLLYAGNRFVSILQTTNVNQEGVAVDQSQAWVNEVAVLEPAMRVKSKNILEESHFPLSKALGTNEAGTDIDQWAIVRESAAWVAKKSIDSPRIVSAADIQKWQTIPVQLTSDIVKDEPLALTWGEVLKLETTATDAFTSQDEDIVAIVTNDSIKLYPYKLPDAKPVTIPINSNESVVMVQWATQQKYVDNWPQMLRPWFTTTANPS
ncbi:hypothetical protein [Cohnella silvisoli]|uniref:Uncharacterized protein n=1 Tax=Cohnella silvisoli TaxID=2873699 RepID=A0ABV1KPM9_9BACL|nr:hypothetical protein [Cohnella silvisoli]MCD9021115.1 hypothetical protein [Cohnella silvisoli]